MKSVINKVMSIKALVALMIICATSGAWAEYVAGWDFKSLAKSQWGTSAGTAIAIEGSAPHTWTSMPDNEHVFTVDFSVNALPEAAGAIVSWKMGNNAEIVFGKTATTDGSATLYLGWGYWGGGYSRNDYTTYKTTSGDYYTWTADAAAHTFRVEYDHENTSGRIRGTKIFMDGVQICHVSGLRFKDSNVKAVVLGGCSGAKGQEIMPDSTATFSDVTYSSGIALTAAATLTSNGYTLNLPSGCVLNADGSISIIGGGLSVEFTDGDGFYSSKVITAEVEASSVPSSGTVIDYLQGTTSDGRHVGLSIKRAATLAQSWGDAGNKTTWNQGYNDVTYSTPGNKHKVAFAYGYFSGNSSNSANGGHTYVDGSSACDNRSGLYDSSHNLRKLYVGSLNDSSAVALGMRVYGIKLYTAKLDASGASTAMKDLIVSDGASVAAAAGMNGIQYCGSDFTTGFTIDLAGQTVALGTYPGTSGTITVNDSVGGGSATLTIPEGFTGSFAGSGKLSVTAPSSILPSSGGITLPSVVTIPNASGTVIAADSVTIGNSGILVSTTTRPVSIAMRVENIPSTQSLMAGVSLDDRGIMLTRTATGFQQIECYSDGRSSNNSGSGWGAASTTSVAEGEHWLTFTYQHDDNGTHSYMDGSSVACATTGNVLRYSGRAVSAVALGCSSWTITSYPAATGMVIKDVQIYSSRLSSSQVAKAEAAAAAGWMPDDATGLAWSNSEGGALPGASAVTVIGSITIGSDGTLDLSGITQVMVASGGSVDLSKASGLTAVSVLSGGTATLGLQRPAQVVVMDGGTLNLTAGTMSDIITGYTPTATLTTQSAAMFAGTVTLDGQTVTPVIDGATVTLTGTYVAGNPSYTGSSYWWDYEFNGNGNNTGSDSTELQYDTSRPTSGGNSLAKVWENGTGTVIEDYTASVSGNQMVYLLARPWRHVVDGYPSEFTAVMYCKAGTTANASLVCFGSKAPQVGDTSVKRLIALTTGGNPSSGQMRLVLIDPTLSGDDRVVDLVEGGFRLDNITTANHLYAFTVQTVDGVSHISVYADGELLTTYIADSIITLGTGFQIGSIHGAIESWMGLSYLSEGDNNNQVSADTATMDFLRVSNTALTSEAIKALAKEYPYVSPNGIATRVIDANGTWSDSENTPWSQKTLNQDGSSTTTDQAAPNNGTGVEITATTDVQLTMDLSSEVSYEKVTFQGDGAITVKAGGTGTVAPTVTTRTYINTDVTIDVAAFASLGAIKIANGKTLTIVPDESSAYETGRGLGIRGIASTVLTGTVELGTDAQVVLSSSIVDALATYGFTLTLTPDASNRYVYNIARDDNPVHITKSVGGIVTYEMYPDTLEIWQTVGWTLPEEPATIPEDFASSVTIVNNHASESLTVATAFAGGTVPVTVSAGSSPVILSGNSTFGGTITLNGATTLSGTSTISGAVSGSATLTVGGSVTVASTGSIANTIAGDGTITFEALPASALSFGEWTGTVVLPNVNGTDGGFRFDYYGKAGSTIEIANGFSGWLNTAEDARQIKANMLVNSAFTISGTNSGTWYNLAKMSGSGNFSLVQSNAPSGFHILVMEDYTGTLSNTIGSGTPTALTISRLNLASAPSVNQKLVSTTTPDTINIERVYVGDDEQQDIILEKKTDGIYVAAKKSTETVSGDTVTVLDTGSNTSVDATGITGKVAIPGTIANISGVTAENLLLKVEYGSEQTAYYTNILAVAANGAVSLKATGEVDGVKVQPEVKTDESAVPMSMGASAATFTVKAIPGLWYSVEAADTIDGLSNPSAQGTSVQAVSTTVNPVAPAFTGTVKYYRIKVSTTGN